MLHIDSFYSYLQFADVFEGFEPKSANRLRMIASSVTGSMNKIKSSFEPIVNFVNRVNAGIANAWDYAKNTNFTDVPGIKQVNDVLNMEIHMPSLNIPTIDMSAKIAALREGLTSGIDFLNRDIVEIGKEVGAKCSSILPAMPTLPTISFHGKPKYSTMTVTELETHLAAALAEGGINE